MSVAYNKISLYTTAIPLSDQPSSTAEYIGRRHYQSLDQFPFQRQQRDLYPDRARLIFSATDVQTSSAANIFERQGAIAMADQHHYSKRYPHFTHCHWLCACGSTVPGEKATHHKTFRLTNVANKSISQFMFVFVTTAHICTQPSDGLSSLTQPDMMSFCWFCSQIEPFHSSTPTQKDNFNF